MRFLASLALLGLIALSGCGAATPPRTEDELIVFAASSLTAPFGELAPDFSAAHGVRVAYSFAGSPQLRTQLAQGARADLFAPANREQMDAAIEGGVATGEAVVFAQNRLVVAVPRGNPGRVERLADLARPGVKLLIAQPEVPVGAYAREALLKMSADPRLGPDFASRVLANVVSQESNVNQIVAKLRLGEGDAGFVYASDAPPGLGPELRSIEIPDELNVVAEYPIAAVTGTDRPALGRAFVALLLSDRGRDVLAKHGFAVPPAHAAGKRGGR